MAPSSPIPPTLLTLRLSSPSFLETILTHNGRPVYSTETYGSTTSLSRCDPLTGLAPIADIHWPDSRARAAAKGKGRDSPASAPTAAQVIINGSPVSEDELLKRNCLNTSRKFRIPGHPHSLKWRRVHGIFQCVTSSGTPVAVFEPPIITAHARLNVFVSTLAGLPQLHSDDVSSILVDYLLVTALLLLTHPEDWQGFNVLPATPPVRTPSAHPSRATLPLLDIPTTSQQHLSPHAFYPPQTRSASGSSPVSPITSTLSEVSTSSSLPSLPSWEHRRQLSTESCLSPQRSRSHASLCARSDLDTDIAPEEKDVVEYEPPPPYEEIQWTVRVLQPRRVRT